MNHSANFQVDNDTQTVSELWENIAKIAKGRVEDNELSAEYPLSIRIRQTHTIKCLVDALERSHAVMNNEP